MPLESLLGLVETLRERAQNHRDALTASEALTRYALIDPLLRELGWDTSDPAMVMPEYRSGSGSADYALLTNGSPAMMVEAKKLGTPLQDSVVAQGINYCLMEGTKALRSHRRRALGHIRNAQARPHRPEARGGV